MSDHMHELGHEKKAAAKKAKASGKKRPLTRYNKFMQECSNTPEAKTRSGKDMMKYCAAQWRKLSDDEQAEYE